MFRCYLNSFDEFPFLLSVDEGTIETERKVRHIDGIGVNFIFRVDLEADNVHNPKVWIEVDAAKLTIEDDIASFS